MQNTYCRNVRESINFLCKFKHAVHFREIKLRSSKLIVSLIIWNAVCDRIQTNGILPHSSFAAYQIFSIEHY